MKIRHRTTYRYATPVAFKATETFAVPVRFTPVDLVSYTGRLTVDWKFVGAVVPDGLPERGSFSINLDGQGTASPFRVAPPSGLDFGEGFLGEESVARSQRPSIIAASAMASRLASGSGTSCLRAWRRLESIRCW